MQTQTPQPNTPIPARLTRHSRGVGNPSLLNNHTQLRNSPRPFSVIPSLPPNTELEAEVGAVLLSPSPFPPSTKLEAEVGAVLLSPSPFPPSTKLEASACAMAQALPSVFSSPSPSMALRERGIKGERVPFPHHAKSPENPLGVIQSNQLRVQSTFNHSSIKLNRLQSTPHPTIMCRHHIPRHHHD